MSKFLPDDPREFVKFFRDRADGHAPGYDLGVFARPHQWLAVAKALEDAASAATPRDGESIKLAEEMQTLGYPEFGDCLSLKAFNLILKALGAAAAPSIPTPEQIEPILDDFLGVDSPHYEELRRRCAQRIFELCVVRSGLPIAPSDNKISSPDSRPMQRVDE